MPAVPPVESGEELFEDAPCGYVSALPDGTILRVNRTFETWTGRSREDLVGIARFPDLLSAGGRIYHETHVAPLLRMQGAVREIAVEVVAADGTRLPALINSVLHRDAEGRPRVVRTTVFDATDRRRYEEELLRGRQRERELAEQLQRSLLSGTLPVGPGFEIGVAYHAGAAGLEVGGDWYDAFWLDDGETLGLVVGDVVGRGLEAATTMGQLRSAVRALALTGLSPGQLLEALDAYARRHDLGRMTTVAYAQLEPASGALRFACAGHLPPLVVQTDGSAAYLWGGRSVPLAPDESGSAREETEHELAPGSVVVLYSDGLVERRTQSLDDGMATLSEQLSAHRAEPAPELADALLRALRDPEHADDVCILAARVVGGGMNDAPR